MMVPRIACSLGAQADRIDELERAVRRLEHVEVVDIAVYEDGVAVIVGAAATLHAGESVLDGRFRARPTRLLPQTRQQVGILARLVGARRQVDIGTDWTPEPGSDIAHHVVPRRGIRHDVVHGSPESLEQERTAVEVGAQQAHAAIAVSETQHGGLEGDLAPSPRNADLEDSRRPIGECRLDHERGVAPRNVAPMVNDHSCARDSTTEGNSSSHAAFPSAMTLFQTSSGMSSITAFLCRATSLNTTVLGYTT